MERQGLTAMSRLKKFNLVLAITLLLSFIFSCTSFAKQCGEIRGEVLRLHILANSDSDADQALKIKVRDAVLAEGADIFDGASDLLTAQNNIEAQTGRLKEIAEHTIRENGYSYPVSVVIGKEYFNTRTYDDVTLPAGQYNAVRVLIGTGEGKNWWCVMFPPMCLPAAESEATIDQVLTEEGTKLVKSNPKYEVRFKIIEIFEELKDKLTK